MPPRGLVFDPGEPRDGRVRAIGEVDVDSVDDFTGWLDRARAAGHRVLHVDVAAMRFADGVALRALVEQAHRFRAVGGRLVLEHVSQPLHRLLAAADVLDQVEVVDPAPIPGRGRSRPTEVS